MKAQTLQWTHCVIGWCREDAKQAGDTTSDAREHALTLLQSSALQFPGGICTCSQQLILHRGQDKASTLRKEKEVRNKEVKLYVVDLILFLTNLHKIKCNASFITCV